MEEENKTNQIKEWQRKLANLPTIVVILLVIICLMAAASIQLIIEDKHFVQECNQHWLNEIDRAYPPTMTPIIQWNGTPGAATQATLGLLEKVGIR